MMTETDNYTPEKLANRQKTEPVFLTNGLCENAHGSAQLFALLGLPFSQMVQYKGTNGIWTMDYVTRQPGEDTTDAGEVYPLTADELKYIGGDMAPGPYGGVMMGYSVVYEGRKWFSPTVDVCYTEGNVFSVGSYGGTEGGKTAAEALDKARRLADALRPQVEAVGGKVLLLEEYEPDRHGVMALFPPEWAMQFGTYDRWEKRVSHLFNDAAAK